jgi:hypothetical protein
VDRLLSSCWDTCLLLEGAFTVSGRISGCLLLSEVVVLLSLVASDEERPRWCLAVFMLKAGTREFGKVPVSLLETDGDVPINPG